MTICYCSQFTPYIYCRKEPSQVETLAAQTKDPHTAELSWTTDGVSRQDGFSVTYQGEYVDRIPRTVSVINNVSVTVVDLQPGDKYTFTVYAISHGQNSDEQTATTVMSKSVT